MKNPSTSDPTDQSDGRPTFSKLIDSRIIGLTLMNALLYWAWCWLRSTMIAELIVQTFSSSWRQRPCGCGGNC